MAVQKGCFRSARKSLNLQRRNSGLLLVGDYCFWGARDSKSSDQSIARPGSKGMAGIDAGKPA
jgi:hypothetical protein